MCLHASWMKAENCTRCNPPKKAITTFEVVKEEKIAPHVSTIPPIYIPQVKRPLPEVGTSCVGCGTGVNPAFCYQGSVLDAPQFSTLLKKEVAPILGEMRSFLTHAQAHGPQVADRAYVLGGEVKESKKRISFRRRRKGLLCDLCASCITMIDDHGVKVPLVITDAKGDYKDLHAGTLERTFARPKGFNTRVTQGRRGRRI